MWFGVKNNCLTIIFLSVAKWLDIVSATYLLFDIGHIIKLDT